jgi:uncharacterized protein (DUF3084 family)
MIDFLKRLFKIKTDSQYETNESRHYKDLMPGPKIYIEGKPYVKVKLRFVDTLSYDITKHIDQLETEIEFQRVEIERLSSLTDNYEKRNNELQSLNINLLNDNRINTNKLNRNIADLTIEKENKAIQITELQKSIQTLNKSIESLKNQIKQLQIDLGSKDNRIGSLDQQVHFLLNKQNPISSKKGFVRLRNALHTAEHDMVSKFNEIEKKDQLIAVMTQKIFEKETKIHELETMLNPNKKK